MSNRGVPIGAQWVKNQQSIPEDVGWIPGLTQWVKDPVWLQAGCSLGPRCSSDPVLPWLWHRLVAGALIQPLGSELPHAADGAVKRKRRKKKESQGCVEPNLNTSLVQITSSLQSAVSSSVQWES